GSVNVVSPTSITATFTISSAAVLGIRNVTVTTSGGASGSMPFSVGPAVPTLVSISLSTGFPGDVLPVTLTGTNFLPGATVLVGGLGVTVSGANVVNSTTLTATFTISSAAAPGARNVTVSTAAGSSGGL